MIVFARSVLDLIGKTPTLRISKLVNEDDATILVKLEYFNPSGSIKDRIAKYIIEHAEREGTLNKKKIILEASSGNTAISLAMIAAVKDYKCLLVIPQSISPEKLAILQLYGAETVCTPAEKGTGGAFEEAQNIFRTDPRRYFMPNQFHNPLNVAAHYQTTARELLAQTHGILDMLVGGVGTGGTLMGVGKRLKEAHPNIKIVAVEPHLGETIAGLRNMGELYPPSIFDETQVDETAYVTLQEAKNMMKRLAREEGILAGLSSGAVCHVALGKAKTMGRDKTIVVILPDSGQRYLKTRKPKSHNLGMHRKNQKMG